MWGPPGDMWVRLQRARHMPLPVGGWLQRPAPRLWTRRHPSQNGLGWPRAADASPWAVSGFRAHLSSQQVDPILAPAAAVRCVAPSPAAATRTRALALGTRRRRARARLPRRGAHCRSARRRHKTNSLILGSMEALRAWRASSNLIGFAASRAAASRTLGLRIRCCSAAAATTNPPAQPQDRRRRSASSSASTSDRDSIRAIRLKKVSYSFLCRVFSSTLFAVCILFALNFRSVAATDGLGIVGFLVARLRSSERRGMSRTRTSGTGLTRPRSFRSSTLIL